MTAAAKLPTVTVSQCWYNDTISIAGIPTPTGELALLRAPVQVSRILSETSDHSVVQANIDGKTYYASLPNRLLHYVSDQTR